MDRHNDTDNISQGEKWSRRHLSQNDNIVCFLSFQRKQRKNIHETSECVRYSCTKPGEHTANSGLSLGDREYNNDIGITA